MQRIILLFITFSLIHSSFGQNLSRLAQSDSLYARGVDLYHAEKYEEAIPIFEKSKSIDSEELDSLNIRVTYIKQWLASCYFKLGKLKEAALYDECGFDLSPIDRRLLTKRDSISNTISENDNIELLVKKLHELYQSEYTALKGESRLTLGTRMNITLLTMILESKQNIDFLQNAKKRVRQILNDCDILYGENSRLKKYLLATAIQNVYAHGGISDIVEGCDELFICLEKNGESESEFALNIWKNLADAYAQVGMMNEYNQTAEHILSIMGKLYGKDDGRYIGQLLTFSQVNYSMKWTEIALQYDQTAEELAIAKGGKYCEWHLLVLINKANIFTTMNKLNETKKILKLIARKADATTDNGKAMLSVASSLLLTIGSVAGKYDKDLVEEVYGIRQEIADTHGKDNEIYCTISTALMAAHMTADIGKAIKIADEEGSLFEKRDLFEPLFLSSFIYLGCNHYVKSRKASSAALEILNNQLNRRYAAQEVIKSSNYIDNGLSVINTKLADVHYVRDTISYSLSMIKQDLLHAKLLILEHSDSLGTNSFLEYLKDYTIVAMKDTKDQLMADSIVNRFSRKVKDKFGKESQEYQKVSEIMDIAKFEIEYSTLAWNVQHYKNCDRNWSYYDSLYKEAVTEYNQTFERWKKGELEQNKYSYSPPETPYIGTVLKERNFQEAFLQYEKAFDYELNHSSLVLAFNEAIPMGICADSMGAPNMYMIKMEEWKKKLIENKSTTSIYGWSELLAAIRLHTDNATYETYEKDVLEHVNENERLGLQISAILKVIDGFDFKWEEQKIYKPILISSLYRLDYFLNILENRKDEKDILPIYTAVLYAKYMTLYHDYYFYGYDSPVNLLDDFKNIYQLLTENTQLLNYKESFDVMCMLCEIAYDKKDYKLVVAADRLRKMAKRRDAILQQKSIFASVSSSSFNMDFREWELGHLEVEISLAYHYSGEEKTDMEKYEDLIASWNDIRAIQQKGHFSNEDLEKKIQKLSKDVIYALSAGDCSDSIKRLAYDFALFSKGYLLRSEQELIKVLKESGNRTVLKQYEDYMRIKRQLDDSTLPSSELERLKGECNNIMSELRYSSKTFDDYTKSLEASWKDVQDALDEDEVAIEYINNGDSYYALVLKKEYDAPIVSRRFYLDNEIKELGDSVYSKYTYSSIWPNFIYINSKEVKNIYFSPTGLLHQVAMENMLSDSMSDTPMCEKYNLYRVSNTREIIKHKNNLKKVDTPTQKAALYGGMEYHINENAWAEIALKNQHEGEESMFAMRDVPSFERGVAFYLEPLPGTNKEVKQIADLFDSSDVEAGTYTGTYATEDEFKRTSGSDITMLHVATHGFYQTQEEIKDSTTITFIRTDDNKEDQTLSRSGLFMTGASAWFYGETIPDNVNDGILTAREISHLDLTNVDLVVLSACETGLGEITGDGVFGLQRGFKKAGVQSMIMSLWKVDDQATQILMTEFYRNLITHKQTKRQALVNARNYLRSYENGRFSNPRYWAAFILLDGID